MADDKPVSKDVASTFLLIIIFMSIAYYFFAVLPKNHTNTSDVSAELKRCGQLYEQKKSAYWSTIGRSSAAYNRDMKACLAMNIVDNGSAGKYSASVINMENGATLLEYSATPKGSYFDQEQNKRITCESEYDYLRSVESGKETKEGGCGKSILRDQMFTRMRNLGFSI
jgi:hypothetical protein